MNNQVAITLIYYPDYADNKYGNGRRGLDFTVETAVNTTQHLPGKQFRKEDVDSLVALGYNVTIKGKQI